MTGDFDYTIGRTSDSDFRVARPDIAARHASLHRRGDRLFIQDLRSTTGTYVNGKRIPAGRRVEVTRFDSVRLGHHPLELGARLYIGRERLGIETQPLHFQSLEGHCLCDGAYLSVKPGSLTAIMGPSGCGKSVFLNLISGIYTPHQGEVLLGADQVPLHANRQHFAGFVGFVPQADVLLPELTVEESLDFRLRLSYPDMERAVRQQQILRVCERLGFSGKTLDRFLKTRIGAPDEKGKVLSGGQRKRASIAHELITQPLIIILDEPTSGLSSKDADDIIELLKSLTQRDGTTVIATIHQPSRYAFLKFDNLLLMLPGGKPLYHGSTQESLRLLTGKSPSDTENPAETLISLCSAANSAEITPVFNYPPSTVEETRVTKRRSKPPAPIKPLRQTATLIERNWRVFLMDRGNLWFTILQVPIIALFIACLLAGAVDDHAGPDQFARSVHQMMHNPENIRNNGDRLRAAIEHGTQSEQWIGERHALQYATTYYMICLATIWFGLLGASKEIVTEQAVIAREGRSGVSPSAALGAKFTCQSLIASLQALLLLLLLQAPLLNLPIDRLLDLMGVLALTVTASVGLGLLISAIGRSYRSVLTLVPVVMIPQVLFGGLLRSLDGSGLENWLSYATIARWSFQWSIQVDPMAHNGILIFNAPQFPSSSILSTKELLDHLIQIQETGLTALFFPENTGHLAVITLVIFTISLPAFTRLIMHRQLAV